MKRSRQRGVTETNLGLFKLIVVASLIMSIASTVLVSVIAVQFSSYIRAVNNTTGVSTSGVTTSYKPINVTGDLITPAVSLADSPPILTQGPFGNRLTNINAPLNSSELEVINDAPDSYYESAARMLLNHSLNIAIGANVYAAPLLLVNGKPTVTYLGAISCPFCAENRWAMAMALSRFGSFQQLFKGYSAIGDGDVPTIYWAPARYNATSAVEFGNFYQGKYVNFVSIEYSSPITAAFEMQPLSYFQQQATALANPVYENATNIIISLNNYAGTPDTIWGKYSVPSADASNIGDPTTNSTTTFPMASLTHEQILAKFANPTTPFAWDEYAAADYYVALVCASMASPAPVCSLPYVSTMVSQAKV